MAKDFALVEEVAGVGFDTESADAVEIVDDGLMAFAGVAEELRRQYSLGYYPTSEAKAGERRRVKIQVARPNVVVRAKSSYVIKQKPEDAAVKQPTNR